MLRDLIIALSLANLCFLPVWERIGYLNLRDSYFIKTIPTISSFGAFIINVLIFAGLFWAGILLVRRLNNRLVSGISKLVFGLLVLICYYVTLIDIIKIDWLQTLLRGTIILLTIVFLIRRSFTKMAAKTVLMMAPLVIIIMAQAAWAIVENISDGNKSAYASNFIKIQTKTPQNQASPRVVWLIFDAMDQQSMFDNKQNYTKLTEFNRLRQQALVANNAYPPGGHTRTAIPALFTGKRVTKATIKSPDDLMLTYRGTTIPVSWRSQSSIFSQARDLKLNTALVGWYHPYSRIYANQVSFCSWNTWTEKYYSIGEHNNTFIANIFTQIFYLLSFNNQPQKYKDRVHQINIYLDTLHKTTWLVSDPKFDLVVIHLPVTHPPYIFDEVTGKLNPRGKQSYFGDLVLADQTLTKLRKVMVEKGLWDKTTLVITADHKNVWDQATVSKSSSSGHDSSDRVPFMIKLAGENQSLTYNRPFNTVLTKDLILAIMEGRIETEAGIVGWLDQRRQ